MTDKPDTVTVVLARHGRTAWNVAGRFQGHGNPALDAVGRDQAATAAKEIAAFVAMRHPTSIQLVASDLRRADQTATAVADRLGVPARTDAALREVYLGGWEGLTRVQAAARFPDEWREWAAGHDVRRGQGETAEEAGRRVVAVIGRELTGLVPGRAGAQGGDLLVVVGHGLALQAAMDQLVDDGRLCAGTVGGAEEWDGSAPAPHLGNGRWVAIRLTADRGRRPLVATGP